MTTNLSDPVHFKRRFIKWLKKQKPDRSFDFFALDCCVFASFARDNKFPFSTAGRDSYNVNKLR